MKRILVTGAAGFIGHHCISLLKQKGFEVHAVSSRRIVSAHENAQWHFVNLFNEESTTKLIEQIKPSHMMHFAWFTKHGEYWNSRLNYDWVHTSMALLEAFAMNGGERVVYAGTCAEYDWTYGYCSENFTPCKPTSTYGICKNALRQLTGRYAADTGLSMSWGRIFHLYGPGENDRRLVPSVIRSLLDDKEIICTRRHLFRDFLAVQDVASVFAELLCSDIRGAVNIGSGIPVSIADIYERIAELMDKRHLVHVKETEETTGEPHMIVADTGRLRNELGWKPQITLEQGLTDSITWWSNRIAEVQQ